MSLADDARGLATRRRSEIAGSKESMKRLNKVLLCVQRAADKGKFMCEAPNFFYRPLRDDEMDVLRDHGFDVNVGPFTGEVYIEWGPK